MSIRIEDGNFFLNVVAAGALIQTSTLYYCILSERFLEVT